MAIRTRRGLNQTRERGRVCERVGSPQLFLHENLCEYACVKAFGVGGGAPPTPDGAGAKVGIIGGVRCFVSPSFFSLAAYKNITEEKPLFVKIM